MGEAVYCMILLLIERELLVLLYDKRNAGSSAALRSLVREVRR